MPLATIDRRIGLLFLAFVVLLLVALGRAAYLGGVQASSLQQWAATEHVTPQVLAAPRGTITDRSGVELAISESVYDIAANPHLIRDPQTVASELAPVLNVPATQLLIRLTKPHTGFQYLAYKVTPATATAVMKLMVEKGINGLDAPIPDTKVVYPRGSELEQVLGQVSFLGNPQPQGLGGLELFYNKALTGTNGMRQTISDAHDQVISVDTVHPVQPGKTLTLTIDSALQSEVEQVLAGVGAQYQPRGATAVVMDPNSGAIMALANWPAVNADNTAGATPYAMEDRSIGFTYEPGSTFKAVTVAGAVEDGLVGETTPIQVPSELHLYDRTISDAELHGDEVLTVRQILQRSSNIGADEIGMRLGEKRFDYWVHRFGFGAPTGVDLPGEEPGIVLHWQQYSGVSMGNLPMGQGENVTLMQMIAAYAAIANGGILRPPHIVGAIGGKPVAIPAGRRIISPQTAYEMRDMLRGVFADGGTASGAEINGWDMAGKTGTASIVVNGKYSQSAYIASFIGMVPTNDPRLLVAVMVDQPNPQIGIYGGLVAAPAFRKIVSWAVPYFQISPR